MKETLMLPFRFRVWIEREKKMFGVKTLHFNADGITKVEIIGNVPLRRPFNSWSHTRTDIVTKGYIVMQSTGVFDINNEEIFDGDIVEYEGKWLAEVARHTWDSALVLYQSDEDETGDTAPDLREIWQDEQGEFKKVGNIYENPDLHSKICNCE